MATVGDVCRVTINHHFLTVRMAVTLWFRCWASDVLPGADTQPAAIIANTTGTETSLLTALRLIFSTSVLIDNATSQQYLPNPRQAPVLYPMPGGGVAGGTGATMAPPLCCLVLPLRAGLVGRSNLGRLYFSPCWGQFVAPNQWLTGAGSVCADVNSWAAGMYSRFKSGGTYNWEWGVWSPKFGDTGPRPHMAPYDPAGFRPLLAAPTVLDPTVRSQRRRQK